MFESNDAISKIPVLIQTNGIKIGKEDISLDRLQTKTEQLYLFELSFKGTNRNEFSLLTGKEPELYGYQLKAYEILHELYEKNHNIQVVAVLGVYHSSVVGNESKYVFTSPNNGNALFDNQKLWNEQFRNIWSSTRLKWVEPVRRSPKRLWEGVYERCGPLGTGILKYYPDGLPTNPDRLFPMKPQSHEYARLIVHKRFWP